MRRYVALIGAITLTLSIVISSQFITNVKGDNSYHFGFKKSKNNNSASIAQEGYMDILRKYDAIFLGDTSKKELYLTFDNGYENGYTAKILDVLKEKQVPATFFVTGHYVKTEPELIIRMTTEGHIIGNHSWSHPDMTTISAERIKEELNKVENEVFKLTGQLNMRYLRPPRGIFNEQSLAVSRELGYTNVFWSVAYVDWNAKSNKGSDYAYNKIVSQLHSGAVVLLHTVSKDNSEALASIIDEARKEGYEFKSLDQMETKSYN